MKIARCTALCIAALAVLVFVPMAVAAKLEGGARYAGKTAGGSAVQLRLSGNARRVARMRIHYTVHCDNDGQGETYTDILNARVRKDRTFYGKGSYTGADDGSVNRFKVSGQLSRRRASGTFSLAATAPATADSDAVTCKSGRVRWHAARSNG